MALSKVQKAAIAESAAQLKSNLKRRADSAIAAAEDSKKKVQAKLREEVKTRKSETLIVGGGTIAAGAVASQVHRELAVKRARPGLAKGINYGAAALGLGLAYMAKPNQAGVRILGASLCGMGAGQAFNDLSNTDLIPGFNG